MISESGSVEAMLRSPGFPPFAPSMDHSRLERLDPMQNQLCRVCEEPAAGFHFGAFTCEGCKSFFGRTCNNQSVIQECKNNYQCVVDKKNRTACKACRLRKCLMVGMSKSGSRYGRRSNWFKIHCLMQQNIQPTNKSSPTSSSTSNSSLSPTHPLNVWPSPSKTDHVKEESIKEPSPPQSPDPPTMVPRTSVTKSFSPSPLTALSPAITPTSSVKPLDIPAAIPSLYNGFPSPLSLINAAPTFPGIPFHKQALLSPLLAQSHLWHMASRHPLLNPGLRPEVDLLAEHKALLEKFAQTSAAALAASVAEERDSSNKSVSPPKTPEPLQQGPMDLSSRKEEAISKEDVNKNLVVQEKVLNLCSKTN